MGVSSIVGVGKVVGVWLIVSYTSNIIPSMYLFNVQEEVKKAENSL